jgi:uncharacterized protein (TIGR03067 family)
MPRFIPVLWVLTCSALLLGAEDKAAENHDPLAGSWEVVSMLIDGESNQISETVLTCEDGSYMLKVGDRQIEAGKYKLDAKAEPKTIDLEITEGDDRGKRQFGIWKFEKEELVLCFAFPAADQRPKEFSGAKDSEQILVRLKKRTR